MRVIHVKPGGPLSEAARQRLETIFSGESDKTVRALQKVFPAHRICAHLGHIQVTRPDGRVLLDAFRDGMRETHWLETNVPLRVAPIRK